MLFLEDNVKFPQFTWVSYSKINTDVGHCGQLTLSFDNQKLSQ